MLSREGELGVAADVFAEPLIFLTALKGDLWCFPPCFTGDRPYAGVLRRFGSPSIKELVQLGPHIVRTARIAAAYPVQLDGGMVHGHRCL